MGKGGETMLQFILGRAGSGKTEQVLRALANDVNTAHTLLLLVPEQFSFESERLLLARLGVKDAAKVQVLSFTRLADRVLRDTGGIAMHVMDDVTRALLMSRALEIHAAPENRQGDTLLKARVYDPAYLSSLLALSCECKQCGISPALLQATANTLPDCTLKSKLCELSSVFDIYNGLTHGSGVDPEDILHILVEKLPESHLYDSAHIYVDGFKGFTAVELEVLDLLMQKADLTVTLCTDTPDPDPNTTCGLFAPVERSLRQLRYIAADRGIQQKEPLVLTDNHRAQHPALAAVERDLFSPRMPAFEGDATAITVTPCPDVYSECAAAARAIRRALREDGLRARDIAVVVRNLADYRGILDTALRRAEIPCYMDEAADVYTKPLVSLCLSALHICAGGWQSDELLRIMKTGLLPFDEVDTATLENYVFMWRIDGKRWGTPFTANPAGMTENRKFDKEMLTVIEGLRRRLTAPLATLRKALSGQVNGKEFAKALYTYLTDPAVAADEGVKRLYKALTAEGEAHLASQTAKLWDSIMELLDRFAAAFEAETLPVQRYADLFHMAAALISLPGVPQGLDAVQIGSADHVRLHSPKAVYVLGVNEGVFPAYPTEGNLLSDREREILEKHSVFLSGNRLLKAAEERFFLYTTLAAPSHSLYVSYVLNKDGEAAVPAAPIKRLEALMPLHKKGVCHPASISDMESLFEALDRLALDFQKENTEITTLKEVISSLPQATPALETIRRSAKKEPFALEPSVSTALFGKDMSLSASQVDSYHSCRFKYFCQYGIQLKTRKIADIDHAVFGNLSHYVLETLLPEYVKAKKAVSPADIPAMRQCIHDTLHTYIEEQMGGFADKPARFIYLLSLVERTAFSLLWFAVNEMAQSKFVPTDYELAIQEKPNKNQLPAPKLDLDNGGHISIVGKIDRVDIYRRKNTTFVRVIDYKTGTKEFKLNQVPYGINMQMLLYLFAVCQNGFSRYSTSKLAPAGVLYLPAKDITQKNAEATFEERLKLLRMNGLVLRDVDVLTAMEADGAGVFIPATVSDNIIGKKSSAASLSDFENIRKLTEQLLINMANTLLSGDIAAIPTGENENLPCRYCEYLAICKRSADDPATIMRSATLENTLKALQENNNEEVTDNG